MSNILEQTNALLPNIPRIYTALSEILACLVVILPLSKKNNWKIKMFFGGAILIFTQLFVGTWPLLFWIPGMIISVFIMFHIIDWTSQSSRIVSSYYCCKAFILAEFIASLSWQLYCYIILGRYNNDDSLSIPFIVSCYFVLFVLFFLIDKKFDYKMQAFELNKRDMLLAVLTAIIIFTMSNIGFMLSNTSYPIGDTGAIFIFRTLINLCGLCILYIQDNQRYETFLRGELSSIDSLFQSQYEQYAAYKESSQIIQRQFHDLKHQISIIRSEKNSKKRELYLQEMTDAINIYSAVINTGHPVLDTILTSKNSVCIENDISFTCFADGKQIDHLDVMDICSLFGNALDNAIESVRKIPNKEMRLIDLRIEKKSMFLVISLKNVNLEVLEFKDGIPLTTKENKTFHGYGIKSIALIAKKYGGTMEIETQDFWFKLKMAIPIKIK